MSSKTGGGQDNRGLFSTLDNKKTYIDLKGRDSSFGILLKSLDLLSAYRLN